MFNSRDKIDEAWLGRISFFDEFEPGELKTAADLGTKRAVQAGTVLFDQGDYGTHCFVIVDGSAVVSIRGDYVATVGPGTLVGEMALLEHRPRSATVRAESDMVLLAFETKSFRRMIDASPTAARSVNELLSSRLSQNQDIA